MCVTSPPTDIMPLHCTNVRKVKKVKTLGPNCPTLTWLDNINNIMIVIFNEGTQLAKAVFNSP